MSSYCAVVAVSSATVPDGQYDIHDAQQYQVPRYPPRGTLITTYIKCLGWWWDVGLQFQPNIKTNWRIHPGRKRKVEDSFAEGVNQWDWIEVRVIAGIRYVVKGIKNYVQSTENALVGGLNNEDLPFNWSFVVNKSISSQLETLPFGTVSNTTEQYTTVFDSNNQIRIWWNLKFLSGMCWKVRQ